MKRRQWTAKQKLEIVLAGLRGECCSRMSSLNGTAHIKA